MATLTIDDALHRRLTRCAKEHGVTVEEWLNHTCSAADLPPAEASRSAQRPSSWEGWLDAFAASHGPTGHALDDSRESMYR